MNNPPILGGLRARLVRAGLWTLTGYFVETSIRLLTSLVMTRLLVPEAFGLMVVAITVPTGLAMLSDIGIQSNIVRKAGSLGQMFLRTAWTIQIVRGASLWGVTLFFAALLLIPRARSIIPEDSVLADPQLPFVLGVMGSILAISGLNSVNIYLQERELNLKPLVLRTLISKIISLPIMLTWAFFDRSIWALVAGVIASQATLTLLSHYLIPGQRMQLCWDQDSRKELLVDSKWTALASTSGFIANQGERLIFAIFLTPKQMGFYAIAVTLVDVIRALLQKLHGQLTLPVLSELFRTRPAAAKDAYYKYRKPIDIFTFTAVGFLSIAGSDLVKFLYDDRYTGAGLLLQILGISLGSFPFQLMNSAFIANNEWRNYSLNILAFSISLFIAVIAGYYIAGWIGAVWGVTIYSWPATFLVLLRSYRRGWVDPVREVIMLPFVFVGVTLGLAARWILPILEKML